MAVVEDHTNMWGPEFLRAVSSGAPSCRGLRTSRRVRHHTQTPLLFFPSSLCFFFLLFLKSRSVAAALRVRSRFDEQPQQRANQNGDGEEWWWDGRGARGAAVDQCPLVDHGVVVAPASPHRLGVLPRLLLAAKWQRMSQQCRKQVVVCHKRTSYIHTYVRT